MSSSHFIPDHGGYESLLSFQKSRVVYDATYKFCERFLKRGDRTMIKWSKLPDPANKTSCWTNSYEP